jgi:HTH-type transcriptional regulator / antitoxin HigA
MLSGHNTMKTQINNEIGYKSALEAVENYLQKGFDKLNESETIELQQISLLIEKYEALHYPLPFKPQTIEDMIKIKMIEKKLKQNETAKLLGISTTRLSEVLHGKRRVNLDLAKRLNKILNIDAQFILEKA